MTSRAAIHNALTDVRTIGEKPSARMPISLRKRLSVAAGKISGSSPTPAAAAAAVKHAHQGLAAGSVDVMWCFFNGLVQWANFHDRPSSAVHWSSNADISSIGISGERRMSKPACAVTYRRMATHVGVVGEREGAQRNGSDDAGRVDPDVHSSDDAQG
jgi:hypothetical protein